ncbi:MAG: sigma-70 family RNA polymerase sigma factor [Abitibacteriaceae bacterium]|nr:sigma-70 family RNA polymerase sigma factor [Abditibacteriaceae bacterium]
MSQVSPPTLVSPATDTTMRLLERCRRGDTTAFDEIVAQHQNRIYNLCYWMLSDPEEAADAAQDAFVRAYRSLDHFRGDCAFGTWLHRIAVNVCLDATRRRKRAAVPFSTIEGDEDQSREQEPADTAHTPAEQADRQERHRALYEALAALSENHRTVLVLLDIQGHSYEEAAASLELPLGTVKSRLNRARLALRDKLEPKRELFQD